ncbi:DUF4118 domain-containing protein [Oxalobacteraceae bacterium OM1]|nr:DUF4118 domain-containing protein [Oxalobacteraceae bacterium OM1]
MSPCRLRGVYAGHVSFYAPFSKSQLTCFVPGTRRTWWRRGNVVCRLLNRLVMNICGVQWIQRLSDRIEAEPEEWRLQFAYVAAIAVPLLCAFGASPLLAFLDQANIAMLFLLSVVIVAVFFGRGPAIVSTIVSVAAFDFGFVPPRFSFGVSDLQYLVTFAVMSVVGLLIAQLTSRLRFEANLSASRESESRALYEFARDLSGALQTEQIVDVSLAVISRTFDVHGLILLPDADGRLREAPCSSVQASGAPRLGVMDLGLAQWSYDHAKPAGIGADFMPSSEQAFIPLVSPMRTRGVLVLRPVSANGTQTLRQSSQVRSFAALVAIALERQHYIDVAQEVTVHMESERLRNSLLSALSHDIRTPLTSLVGLSESLTRSKPPLAPHQMELALALNEGAMRMTDLTSTILEMARIQSGKVQLNLQWQYLEEVVGSALRACKPALERHVVHTNLASDLPLVQFDAVLVERVLCNLVENAAKYTPTGSHITIAAQVAFDFLEVDVRDSGPGFPKGREDEVFGKFVRGDPESALPGVGLGLSMCRAIIEAHRGTICASNLGHGGARVLFTLPLGTPPFVPEAEDALEVQGVLDV